MHDNLLEVRDLEVVYKTDLETVRAVNGVSLSLKKGKTLGIVGETGAGKTTTALSVMRLLPARTGKILGGSVTFEGRDLLTLTEKEMLKVRGGKIAMIFQDPMTALNPVLTVGSQIAEALQFHNTDNRTPQQIQERVRETLELVGIPASRANQYPHQFSGGMKQRVVIAIALACQPALLIADEPTTALDVTIQAQVLALIQTLQEQLDTSMMMITHDLGIVAQVCDDVCVMYAGEVVESGTAAEVFGAKARHPYTEGLFGSIPGLASDAPRLKQIDGLMPDPTDLPSGCRFHPRCPRRMAACAASVPPAVTEGTHTVRCHLFA
ncbi:MAG TPA: ABC transporter ATP-binding protein [Candidatus Limnocylindria bacterium]|nr:ABC transporter ATP-binding protein [Candidatus Limnocylindria bacterium]